MIHRLAFVSASMLALAGCGTPPEEQPVDPATVQEAQALEDAASMLDRRELPPTDGPAGPASQNDETSGEIR